MEAQWAEENEEQQTERELRHTENTDHAFRNRSYPTLIHHLHTAGAECPSAQNS